MAVSAPEEEVEAEVDPVDPAGTGPAPSAMMSETPEVLVLVAAAIPLGAVQVGEEPWPLPPPKKTSSSRGLVVVIEEAATLVPDEVEPTAETSIGLEVFTPRKTAREATFGAEAE
jgi:hypothetical protein